MNKLLSSLTLFLALIMLTLPVSAKNAPPGTGKADVKANILIMLDRSGRMGWTAPRTDVINSPWGIAIDSDGNFWASQNRVHRVTKYTAGGKKILDITSQAGLKRFVYPGKIAVDQSDNIYFYSQSGSLGGYVVGRLFSYDKNGNWRCSSNLIPRITTQQMGIHGWTAQNGLPDFDVDVNPSTGQIHLSLHNELQIYNSSCQKQSSKFIPTSRKGSWKGPIAINSAGKHFHWNNLNGNTLIRYSDSTYTTVEKTSTISLNNNDIRDIAVDGANRLYILHNGDKKIYVYNATSFAFLCKIGSGSGSSNQWGYMRDPHQIAISGNKVWVADSAGSKVVKFLMSSKCTGGTSLTQTNVFDGIFGQSENRIAIARRVLKKVVADTSLTTGANFGLMEWGSNAKIRIPVSKTGAAQIYTDLDRFPTSGGTYLDRGMATAKTYWTGGTSPISPKANCQQNYNLVFSDGQWWGSQWERDTKWLKDNKGVKTFAVGYAGYGNTQNYQKLATAGGTTSPMFADDEDQLLSAITYAVKQVLQARLTFTTPVIMPDVASGDSIYQAVFNYKKDHQWQGRLKRYELKADGTIGAQKWDAGEKMNSASASSRRIWSVGGGLPSPSSLNNFTAANVATLRPQLSGGGNLLSPTAATDLINFTRGIDVYDEDKDGSTTDERWKLADIYHSSPLPVGPPSAKHVGSSKNTEAYYRSTNGYASFKSGLKTRDKIILAGSNGGMVHAFNLATGAEKWAFIPPSILGNLKGVVSAKANTTNSIFGVDGTVSVKDVFIGGAWKTVAIIGMGAGGKSYTALDVTDVNAPKHMWTFENDPGASKVIFWNAAGVKTEKAYSVMSSNKEYDYSKLGDAVSPPRILRVPHYNASSKQYIDKWVAIFGGGGHGGAATNYGSAVFLTDIGNGGKLLKKIDVADKGANNIPNAVISAVVPVTADTTSVANYKGALVYFADFESKLWKLNLTDKGTQYELQQLFDGEATVANGRRVFHEVALSLDDNNKLYAFFGTGDRYNIAEEKSTLENRLYGIKDKDFPSFNSGVASVTAQKCKNMTSGNATSCPTASQHGWYFNLDKNEKTSGAAAVSDKMVYFSRYTPNKLNPCNPGTAKLSIHRYTCGDKAKEIDLGGGIASTPIIYKGKVYIGISGAPSQSLTGGWTSKDNLLIGTAVSSGGGSTNSFEIKSWRQIF